MAENIDKFLLFNVKPVWKIYFPSTLTGSVYTNTSEIIIYGVDRGSLDISRNWIKVHSVEQYNQGFVATPSDFTVTIAIKEHGDAFELIRRLGMSATLFDIYCDILIIPAPEGPFTGDSSSANAWMRGFEKFIGCVVNREGQTIDVGTFPVREFEIMFLRHEIAEVDSNFNLTSSLTTKEGDGSFPDYDYSGNFIKLV